MSKTVTVNGVELIAPLQYREIIRLAKRLGQKLMPFFNAQKKRDDVCVIELFGRASFPEDNTPYPKAKCLLRGHPTLGESYQALEYGFEGYPTENNKPDYQRDYKLGNRLREYALATPQE